MGADDVREQREASDVTAAALEALREAYASVTALIEANTNPSRALEEAIALRAIAKDHAGDAGVLRDRMAHRVWKAEELSLRCLAVRVGVNKSRAHQIIGSQETKGDAGHGELSAQD